MYCILLVNSDILMTLTQNILLHSVNNDDQMFALTL